MARLQYLLRLSVAFVPLVVLWLGLKSSCADEPDMRLRLKNNSFAIGTLAASEIPEVIGWKSEGFEEDFAFDLQAVRSISRIIAGDAMGSDIRPETEDEFNIEMIDGAMAVGRIVAMDSDWVTIESELLGRQRLNRSHVVALMQPGYAGPVLFSGLLESKHWQPLGKPDDWTFKGGTLVASRQGVAVVGAVDLPAQAQINLSMSWKGAADFVFSLGTLASNRVSAAEQVPSAARLEVWDQKLALLRETENDAAIQLLTELNEVNPRLELTIFLDQIAGTVIVYDPHGRRLGRTTLPAERDVVRSAVHLVNYGPALTLEHFEVRGWDGKAMLDSDNSQGMTLRSDEVVPGMITGFDDASQSFQVTDDGGVAREVSAKTVRSAAFEAIDASPATDSPGPERRPPAVAQPSNLGEPIRPTEPLSISPIGEVDATAPPDMDIVLKDRSRFTGKWLPAQDGHIQFSANGVEGVLSLQPNWVIGVVGTDDRYFSDLTQHKNGTLKIGQSEWSGYFEETVDAANDPLLWHPHGSRSASSLDKTAEGIVVYRRPLANVSVRMNGAVEVIASGLASGTDSVIHQEIAREVAFRNGDSIQAVVQKIDEKGIYFESTQTATRFAEHRLLDAVWLNDSSAADSELSEDKRERLLTVPRASQLDPPTHLVISIDGDFLRGRLLSLDKSTLTIETRLDVVELPRAVVARIVWLQDRSWESLDEENETTDKSEASDRPFWVHVVQSNDRGLTFQPRQMRSNILTGSSELLGECVVELKQVDQLLFGTNITEQVKQFRDNPWALSLAQLPRAFQPQLDSDEGLLGINSDLVGKPAPEFALRDLKDQVVRSNELLGKVIVLDFWASWCGPCIQTMPQLEELLGDYDSAKVELLSINLQETPQRVSAAIERLGLSGKVLLDRDGIVAANYQAQAIPQTVVIDRQGIVRHVFVGGGTKMVRQLREAIDGTVSEVGK